MLSVITSILAAAVPLSVMHWYLARIEMRPVPKRQLGEIEIPALPLQLRIMQVYVIMPAYIAVLGGIALFWSIWRYQYTPQTRTDLIEVSPLLAFSSLMILVGGLYFLWAVVQRITITNSDITYFYGLGQVKVDLLDVRGFSERPSFIFIHFKTARKNLAIPTSFQGLDILAKVLSNAKHGRIY